jgi:hypothetical protein
VIDTLVVLVGIKMAFEGFKVFRAERLGFPMEGEIEISENLSKNDGEFRGKGTTIGGSN